MLGSALYLVGYELKDNRRNPYVKDAEPCSLCKRLIINAGISEVIVRITETQFSYYNVDLWKNKESITGGY